MSHEVEKVRKTQFPIQSLILDRWSPRSMTGEGMTDEELMPLFEAARWAPSCFNSQPWKFFYAKNSTEHLDKFFDLLIDFNKSWCKNAAVLVIVVSRTKFERNSKPNQTHSYDTGAAWQNLALEGSSRGYVVHGMQGFDYKKAKNTMQLPEDYQVEAMIAGGKRAPIDQLPVEIQEKKFLLRENRLMRSPLKGSSGDKKKSSKTSALLDSKPLNKRDLEAK